MLSIITASTTRTYPSVASCSSMVLPGRLWSTRVLTRSFLGQVASRSLPPVSASSGQSPPSHDNLSRELIRYYFQVQEPALANRPYSGAVKDFTERAILAYECGYSEGHMAAQLKEALETGDCGIAPKHAQSFNTTECLRSIMLVWLTLMASPKGIRRWATVDAVSDQTLHRWQGFVSLIVNAYFNQRMAWYSLDRLSMEVSAMGGAPEAPDMIAERARLVFTTLERVYPQFPSDS